MSKIFVDTNVLVYAYDRSEPEKQMRALQVLDSLAITGVGIISVGRITKLLILPISLTVRYYQTEIQTVRGEDGSISF